MTDLTLVKALAGNFWWTSILESGEFTSIAALAEREEIALSYMTRTQHSTSLRQTLSSRSGMASRERK